MAKKKELYADVREMIQDLNPGLLADFDKLGEARKLIKHMVMARVVKGMSQKDVAQKLQCNQSRISKLEGLQDDDMRLGDLRSYAEAVGLEFVAGFQPKNMEPAKEVERHMLAVKKHMNRLAGFARADHAIARGVWKFFWGQLYNFVSLAKFLPPVSENSPCFSMELGSDSQEQPDLPDLCCLEAEPLLTGNSQP